MARGGASGVGGGVGTCSCGCGTTVSDSTAACGCGCSTTHAQSTMEEIAQLKAQRDLIERRLAELSS